MKANCWMGPKNLEVREVPDPKILNQRDAIVKITSTAICGSDLHLYNGFIPAMEPGDILGHEFMGEVVEAGSEVKNLKVGDRVVVPFPIACGSCWNCQQGMYSLCENSNPNAWMAEKLMGYSPAGIFGYTHLLGGYAGGQAEFARVPFADFGPIRIGRIYHEQVLFLSMCSYRIHGERVIAIDRFPYRLEMAREKCCAEPLNYEEVNVLEALKEMTGGRGPDACIDAVGMEAHKPGLLGMYDRGKQAIKLETDRPHALREAILACRNGGTVSVIGVYSGFIDKFPMGAVMNRSLTIKSGQAHVHRYLRPLMNRIAGGEIDPEFIVTHTMSLDEAPEAYEMFMNKEDDCVKVVLKPH